MYPCTSSGEKVCSLSTYRSWDYFFSNTGRCKGKITPSRKSRTDGINMRSQNDSKRMTKGELKDKFVLQLSVFYPPATFLRSQPFQIFGFGLKSQSQKLIFLSRSSLFGAGLSRDPREGDLLKIGLPFNHRLRPYTVQQVHLAASFSVPVLMPSTLQIKDPYCGLHSFAFLELDKIYKNHCNQSQTEVSSSARYLWAELLFPSFFHSYLYQLSTSLSKQNKVFIAYFYSHCF